MSLRPGDVKPPHYVPLHVSLGPEEEYAAFVTMKAEPVPSSASQAAEPPSPDPGSVLNSASQAAEPQSPGPGSLEPVPSSASQSAQADAVRNDDLLSILPGDAPDWCEDEHVNEDAFDVTQELHNGLEALRPLAPCWRALSSSGCASRAS